MNIGVSNSVDPMDTKGTNVCSLSGVAVTKDVDITSPLLAVFSAGGKCWKGEMAEIHVLDEESLELSYKIALEDPAISSVSTSWYANSEEETVVLVGRKISWQYMQEAETWYDRKNSKKSYTK